ncbi:hypothetical protein BGZ95_001218 [Linnemannia exigua]|uniref:Uncharacterized protein n=1 Tax=Linnemannia exigua TaxID=604196 RepID=A0AAD4D772_9FUNG|nr:hypothetical protein BGZ95_001218 [Linnemannia exigua]
METIQAAWPFIDNKTPTLPGFFNTTGTNMSRQPPYSNLVRPKAEQEFLQALIAPLESAEHNAGAVEDDGVSQQQQQDPFQMVYRHLHEKHYLDRLIHAFYHRPTRSQQLSNSPVDLGRIAFHNKVRVVYPRPSEIGQAIDQVHALSSQEPAPLLLFLLTSPELRFRLCMIAHLIEVAFDIGNGTWNGESPRHLPREEADYALIKLQDLFKELYLQPNEQTSLRRLLTILHNWVSRDSAIDEVEEDTESDQDQDQGAGPISGESKLNIPHIVKEIFPCWNPILQEIQNIKISAIGDVNFQREVTTLFRFLFLSLKERNLAFADDWVDEARQVLGPIQDALSSGKYRGPAQRLMREVVCMADQLWEGGGATDTSLAVEKCLTTLIQKSLQGSASLPDSGAGVGPNVGWDVMRDFEILIQAASRGIAPIPLPSIVWKRSGSEMIMDAAVLEFPHLMPSNIHLNTTTAYDRQTNKSCRLWHLKMQVVVIGHQLLSPDYATANSGLEVEAKKVAYSYTSKSFLGGNMMDEGELDIVVPPNSLDIELTFVLTPPIVRRGTATALRSSIDYVGRRHPIASAARENLFTTSLESQNNQLARRSRSTSRNRLGSGLGTTVSPRSVRFSDTASDVGRAAARTGVRFRQQVQETVTEDFWSATREIVSRFLYPNRMYTPLRTRQQQQRQNIARSESGPSGRMTTDGWMTLGRPRRRLSIGSATISPVGPVPFAEPVGMANRKFVELKQCRIDLRRLNVDVLETQHPILQMLSHPIMVRRLRKAVECTLLEMMMELVNTINIGVEQIMEAAREQPQQDETEEVAERPRQRESATMPKRSYEPVHKTGSTDIVAAMPLSSYSRIL